MNNHRLILGLAALAMSLGACSRSAPDTALVGNEATDAVTTNSSESVETSASPEQPPAAASDVNATAEAPASATGSDNTAADAPADAPAPVDQQMMDDASATGMTSRSSRGTGGSDDAGAVPTEPK